jgi:hypothetical protein
MHSTLRKNAVGLSVVGMLAVWVLTQKVADTPYGFQWSVILIGMAPYIVSLVVFGWVDIRFEKTAIGFETVYLLIDSGLRYYICFVSKAGMDVLTLFTLPILYLAIFVPVCLFLLIKKQKPA